MAKTAAERKADQRKREAEYLKKMGAEEKKITMNHGTLAELAFLKEVGGFEESAEAITVMIHNVAGILKRDMSQKESLLNLARLRQGYFNGG